MNFNIKMNECQSPVKQDFMWLAEYEDATFLSEFDLETKESNDFNSINKEMLERYGLIGRGMKFYYEKSSGIFKLVGQMIEVSLKTTNYEFFLTGYMQNSEPIYFNKLSDSGEIIEYNFGYKTKLEINGFTVDFKVICSIPFGKTISLSFDATTNMDTDGMVRIRKNGIIIEEGYKVLNAQVKENYTWQFK